MLRRVLVDTGPLVAILSTRDARHRECSAMLHEIAPPLLTCWPVLTEAAWLLRRWPAAVRRMFESVDNGLLDLLPLDSSAARPIGALMERYRGIGAQVADAALLYLAERHDIETVFTLDQRDFQVYRVGAKRVLRVIPMPA